MRDKIAGTKWEGHLFTVGGCCRDMVLGGDITDVDLAIDLPGGGIEFADWLRSKRLTIGSPVKFEKYGTAMTRLKAFPHDDIEMVQTRAEKYTDRNSRNPETAFGSLKDDCFRRDLTINALYYDISNGKIIDLTGRGLSDIRNRIICTPSDPDSTYDDDPIRILRTIRFATRLGWELPADIFDSMKRNVSRLSIIKPERMRGEFEKILASRNVDQALRLLRECGVLPYIMPQLELLCGRQSDGAPLWDKTLSVLSALSDKSMTLRMAALLYNMMQLPGKLRQRGRHVMIQAMLSLKYHNPFIKEVLLLAEHALDTRSWGALAENMKDADLRKLQYACGKPERLDALLTLIEAINKHDMPRQTEAIRIRLEELHRAGTDMYTYHLPFAERRIKKLLHITPGPLVEDTLRYMLDMAFINPLRSRQEFERLVSEYQPQEAAAIRMPESQTPPDRNQARNTRRKTPQRRWHRSRKGRKSPAAKDTKEKNNA